MRIRLFPVALLLFGSAALGADREYPYEVRYELTLDPDRPLAPVRIVLGEGARHVRWMRFRIDPERHRGFCGDGELLVNEDHVTWTPPEDGGTLSYTLRIDHQRGDSGYDARLTDDWALFRGDDLVPPATVRLRKGARSKATLEVFLPRGWSFVAPYREVSENVFRIARAERSFDRPVGWMAAGRLGVRRERIADVRVAVAAPTDQDVRRMDILAFLHWNLPELADLAPAMPPRLLVVSARDEMWRGGLSGPRSLYLHADRPLISENGTSTLMHELVHTVLRLGSEVGADWIVEGIAEYYSLELMRRSGTISERRFARALRDLAEWATKAQRLDVRHASGPVTAYAVGVMHCLDGELRDAAEEASLDTVVQQLVDAGEDLSLDRLRQAAEAVRGKDSACLADGRLAVPGKP